MDIGSILLLLALVVLVAAFIARPLRGWRTDHQALEVDLELSQLLAERERVLEALAELDFDNDMGKVPDGLYLQQREAFLKRGAAVLRLLDQHTQSPDQPAATEADRAARLERSAKIRTTEDDPLEAMIAARRKAKAPAARTSSPEQQPGAKFCPNCGAVLKPEDRFCPSCGKKLF